MSTRAWWLVLVVAIAVAIAEVAWLAERVVAHRARHAPMASSLAKSDNASDAAAVATPLVQRKYLPLPITGFGPL